MIRDIKYIVTSALLRVGATPTGANYNYLEQVCIEYLSETAPLDGQVSLKVFYADLNTSARSVIMPSDCLRISKIGLKAGNRIWTLTLDPNLMIPEEIFACDKDEIENQNNFSSGGDYLGVGWWWGLGNVPTYGGGRNINYYRIDGNRIIFDHNIEAGKLVIEYMSNGADLNENTMIDMAYSEPIRRYLMAEYYMWKGDMARYQENLRLHEGYQFNANVLVKADRMYELIDAVAQSSSFNI
jgi:hypothetical protein